MSCRWCGGFWGGGATYTVTLVATYRDGAPRWAVPYRCSVFGGLVELWGFDHGISDVFFVPLAVLTSWVENMKVVDGFHRGRRGRSDPPP